MVSLIQTTYKKLLQIQTIKTCSALKQLEYIYAQSAIKLTTKLMKYSGTGVIQQSNEDHLIKYKKWKIIIFSDKKFLYQNVIYVYDQ